MVEGKDSKSKRIYDLIYYLNTQLSIYLVYKSHSFKTTHMPADHSHLLYFPKISLRIYPKNGSIRFI